jgi:hypothetical protein
MKFIPYFCQHARHSFFFPSQSDLFYLLVVGVERYCYTWSQWQTLGRTPPDEGSARRKDLYLTTHNIHKIQSCPRRDSYPQSQQACGRRSSPRPRAHWNRLHDIRGSFNQCAITAVEFLDGIRFLISSLFHITTENLKFLIGVLLLPTIFAAIYYHINNYSNCIPREERIPLLFHQ